MTVEFRLISRRSALIFSFCFFILFLGNSSHSFAQGEGEEKAAEEAPAAEASENGSGVDPQLAAAGKSYFKKYCSSCHMIGAVKVGPALQGVTDRRTKDWLRSWIANPQKMIDSGDPTALELYAEYKAAGVMSNFSLSDQEFEELYAYLGTDDVEKAEEPTTAGGEVVVGAGQGEGGNFDMVLAVVLVVLVLIVAVLILMTAVLVKTLKRQGEEGKLSEEDIEVVDQKHNVVTVLKHPAFVGLVVGFGVLIGFIYLVRGVLFGIGVQQAYQPTQPIPFSHAIHAGQYEIDCNYCHTGVRKAKHANIPAASICMNCHVKVKTESPYIQQIYKAIDYNPETQEFGDNIQPIEWVRIHNLPDLVYFNHSQHVQVAGLECQECHGPIEEMEVVYQYSPLTMGWCIDCHRNTTAVEIAAKRGDDGREMVDAEGNVITEIKNGNRYYDYMLELHEAGAELKVEDIGGLECSRCHY